MSLVFETYEDRPDCLVGLKLLALSLERHAPESKLRIWSAFPSVEAKAWFAKQPNVLLVDEPLSCGVGWNVKPELLQRALAAGGAQAQWIDADIVVTADPQRLFDAVDPRALIAAEEPLYSRAPQGSGIRTAALGLFEARPLPRTVNSCVLRVSRDHLALLQVWCELLRSPHYLGLQRRPFDERPRGMQGDQDVLTALLASDTFADVPFHLLVEGEDIAQCIDSLGFRTPSRLRAAVFGLPPMIHALGEKPWRGNRHLSAELSPYCAVAAQYASELPEEDLGWALRHSVPGAVLHHAFFGSASLRGLPLTVVRELQQLVKRKG